MLRYLHTNTNYFKKGLDTYMVQIGTYTLIPNMHIDL